MRKHSSTSNHQEINRKTYCQKYKTPKQKQFREERWGEYATSKGPQNTAGIGNRGGPQSEKTPTHNPRPDPRDLAETYVKTPKSKTILHAQYRLSFKGFAEFKRRKRVPT